ncbi:MAG: hypothetical protein ITF99_06965 [Chryseobacterium sp.]|nr:hypothetical protein [Chryseobacterium sp.]
MIKIEELIHAYISTQCDFEKQVILTHHFHADWEADLLLINPDGFSHEIEIKFSKSDFKNDFKKFYQNRHTGEKYLKHDKICCGDYVCNHFSFLLPMGMVSPDAIPEHCGIIEFYHDADRWETVFRTVRASKILHETPYWQLIDKDMMLKKMAMNLIQRKFQLKSRTEELIFKNPFGDKIL